MCLKEEFALVGLSAEESISPKMQQQQQQQQQPSQNAEASRSRQCSSSFGRPCVALSWNIMQLYKRINSKLCEEMRRRPTRSRCNDGYDDKHGHYFMYTGEEIWGRYTVLGALGRGSFGTVLRCFDEKHQEQVAVKVVRNGDYFRAQGLIEVDIVSRLNNIPALDNLVVRLRKVFMWKNHLVLVFEMLSMNLFQLIQRTNYNGVSLDLTRKFAYQLVLVLKQLEEHDPPIIHSDVKPENVVLRDASRSSIRLIDFGSACFMRQGATLYKYVQSRFYRSVEVILELNYDTAIDRWSLGCMLVELHTGVPLFPGKTEVDQIARFTGVLGPIPDDMIERSGKKDIFFHDSRQSQQQHPLGTGCPPEDTPEEETLPAVGQRQEVVASPSPVIAADVLHSLSAASSVSAVTVTSGPQGACSSGVAATSGPSPTCTTAASLSGRIVTRNATCVPCSSTLGMSCQGGSSTSNNNIASTKGTSASATSAARRPMTAVNMTSSGKKGGAAPSTAMTGASRGLSSTPSTYKMRFPPSNSLKPQSKSPSTSNVGIANANTAADSGGGNSNATENAGHSTAAVSSRAPAWSRPSNSTPKLRPAAGVLGSGTGPLFGTSTLPQGRVTAPQQMEATTAKSPFTLRVPPTPEQCQSLADIIGVYTGGPRGCRRGQAGHDVSDYLVFLDFIQRLLCYDPKERLSCADALRHPFLSALEVQRQWKYLGVGSS